MLRKPGIWYTVLSYVALSCNTNLQKYSADSYPQGQTSVSLFKCSFGHIHIQQWITLQQTEMN